MQTDINVVVCGEGGVHPNCAEWLMLSHSSCSHETQSLTKTHCYSRWPKRKYTCGTYAGADPVHLNQLSHISSSCRKLKQERLWEMSIPVRADTVSGVVNKLEPLLCGFCFRVKNLRQMLLTGGDKFRTVQDFSCWHVKMSPKGFKYSIIESCNACQLKSFLHTCRARLFKLIAI